MENKTKDIDKFWLRKSLSEMSDSEWESLCDGCGLCCLHKLQDLITGEIAMTKVSCKLLDTHACKCKDYANRWAHVPDCVKLTPRKLKHIHWLPSSCAYRRVDEGKDLYPWHHLISGDAERVHQVRASARHYCISEDDIGDDDLEDYEIGPLT